MSNFRVNNLANQRLTSRLNSFIGNQTPENRVYFPAITPAAENTKTVEFSTITNNSYISKGKSFNIKYEIETLKPGVFRIESAIYNDFKLVTVSSKSYDLLETHKNTLFGELLNQLKTHLPIDLYTKFFPSGPTTNQAIVNQLQKKHRDILYNSICMMLITKHKDMDYDILTVLEANTEISKLFSEALGDKHKSTLVSRTVDQFDVEFKQIFNNEIFKQLPKKHCTSTEADTILKKILGQKDLDMTANTDISEIVFKLLGEEYTSILIVDHLRIKKDEIVVNTIFNQLVNDHNIKLYKETLSLVEETCGGADQGVFDILKNNTNIDTIISEFTKVGHKDFFNTVIEQVKNQHPGIYAEEFFEHQRQQCSILSQNVFKQIEVNRGILEISGFKAPQRVIVIPTEDTKGLHKLTIEATEKNCMTVSEDMARLLFSNPDNIIYDDNVIQSGENSNKTYEKISEYIRILQETSHDDEKKQF